MLDFDVQRFTRKCAKSDRELRPGEAFYSVLLPQGAEVVRHDYASESWQGPPDEAIGWWKSEVPDLKSKKVHWAPNDVMLHYFQQLENQSDKLDVRYVLTLLLVRRRVLKLIQTLPAQTNIEEGTSEETHQRMPERMVVFDAKTETEHEVAVVTPNANRVAEIQKELADLLFAKAS